MLNQASMLAPKRCVKWLGLETDLERCIFVPEEKVDKSKKSLACEYNSKWLQARTVASITGKIISLDLAIGPMSRLRTHATDVLLDTRESWYFLLPLNDQVETRDRILVH